jgi:ornithine cyclodeaminase/alanine dehydrogenase-like protein (mu-crystallin family)
VAISRWGPHASAAEQVAVIGAGVQARSHLPVLAHLLPGSVVTICDRDATRAAGLALEVQAGTFGAFGTVRTTTDPEAAVRGASVVVTMVSFGPGRQAIPASAFEPAATIVAVDYDMCVPASVAIDADLFLTDDREQFLANRTTTQFVGYPEPMAMIGAAIRGDTIRPAGRVLVAHLGVGLADVVFGDAILRAAERDSIGTILPR